MTRLSHEDLYQLLHRVHSGRVVFHTCGEVHACGWSWVQSDMSADFQDLCNSAYHARLIQLGIRQFDGSPASLSPAGLARLEELRVRHLIDARGVSA